MSVCNKQVENVATLKTQQDLTKGESSCVATFHPSIEKGNATEYRDEIK